MDAVLFHFPRGVEVFLWGGGGVFARHPLLAPAAGVGAQAVAAAPTSSSSATSDTIRMKEPDQWRFRSLLNEASVSEG